MSMSPFTRVALAASLVAVALSASACDPLGPQRTELERARALWASVGPDDYTYVVRRNCFCGYVGPARVTVEDGAVVSVVHVGEGDAPPIELSEDLFPGVDGLFEILQDAVDRDAHEMTATYDPDTGVPLEFFIDYEENVADEELGMQVVEPVTETTGGQ